MLNNSKNELKALDLALVTLEAWFDGHDKIDTVFGEQYTVNGYQLESIQFQEGWIKISLFVLDRSVQEKDYVKMGDLVHFLYYIEKNEIKLQE